MIRRFIHGCEGIAAVEFALTLPVMLALWLGMVELSQLMSASAKTNMAAQSVADLVTRYTTQGYSDPSGFADLEKAAATIMAPLATATGNPLVSVVSANFNASGAPTQSWQCTSGTMPGSYSPSALLANAPALTTANSNLSSVIMVTVIFAYSPTISGGITGPSSFTATAFSTPRLVSAIPKPC